MRKLTIPSGVNQLARSQQLPEYFFQGRIGLACGHIDKVSVDWQHFEEAFIVEQRILVIHRLSPGAGWAISDFLTGVRLLENGTRKALWQQRLTLVGRLDRLATHVPINTRSFTDAYLALLRQLRSSVGLSRQGLLCACRDVASELVDYDS